MAPGKVGEVFGIFKAYCTRVGGGPFPTELLDQTGDKIRKMGCEFGATTGRPRRCGWIDLPALRYSIMLSGVTQLFMTKADVLNTFEEIKVCTHYRFENGSITDQMPFDLARQKISPVLKTMPGWLQGLEGIAEFDQLPRPLMDYISFLEQELETPINIVSTGPNRSQTIIRKAVLA